MCLAIPAMLKSIDGQRGVASSAGLELEVDLTFLPEAQVGDYLIIHAGMALSVLEDIDVEETMNLINNENFNE